MLSQTKEEIQNLINKVQVLDFVLQSLNLNHKDYTSRIEEQYRRASNHKLKLTSEILRISGASEVETNVEVASTTQDINAQTFVAESINTTEENVTSTSAVVPLTLTEVKS